MCVACFVTNKLNSNSNIEAPPAMAGYLGFVIIGWIWKILNELIDMVVMVTSSLPVHGGPRDVYY